MTNAVCQSKIRLKIGAQIPHRYLPGEDDERPRIAASESQSWPFIKTRIAGVEYIIGFDDENHRITLIQTIDREFRAANGLRVGSKIKITREQLNIHRLWYTFAGMTPDGWRIIVADDQKSLDNLKSGETRSVTVGGFLKIR